MVATYEEATLEVNIEAGDVQSYKVEASSAENSFTSGAGSIPYTVQDTGESELLITTTDAEGYTKSVSIVTEVFFTSHKKPP